MVSVTSNEVLTAGKNQLTKQKVQVHKFGGSSLATTACIDRVISIIQDNCQLNDIVVVSANGDTTDALFNLLNLVHDASSSLIENINLLFEQQKTLISSLLNKGSAARLTDELIHDIKQLTKWLQEDLVNRENDILAFGELWSAKLLSAILNERVCPSQYVDSRDFLLINNDKECLVQEEQSRSNFEGIRNTQSLVVVTGYICKDLTGKTKTLGRNGSDYSATIMASLSKAGNVTLWTDVDGIYSADPRVVPSSRKLHRLPSGVAKELGRLGNPVLHAKTLKPLTDHSTHLHVASSFDPTVAGTEIGKFGQIAKQELSVTFLNDLLLVRSSSLQGDSGEEVVASFDNICADTNEGSMVIYQGDQKKVSQYLASYDTEVSFTPVGIIAVVGHKVREQGNLKARFKRSLRHIQPLAITDSTSKHSLIAVINNICTVELLNSVHHAMTKDARHIGLVVAGLGNIGESFLAMLPHQLNQNNTLENLHLVGLLGSKKALVNTDGIDATIAVEQYQKHATTYDKELILSWLANHPYDELVVVDITPSEEFSCLYADFFEQGIHIIGANKWAASSSIENYQHLVESAKKHNSLWLGNTTVGAGLPVNYAIEDLRRSGDTISAISGIFSGTLSWLFGNYDGSEHFSTLMKSALEQGLTEPDPREDLSGRDVQRKLLILARMAGYTLSLDDISVQNLVPEHLRDLSTEQFLARANEMDDYFSNQLAIAKGKGKCIRYIAKFNLEGEKLHAKVSLEELDYNHAFASLSPCDNIFQIETMWYKTNPLIIRGPGAGREVTASGLHSDLVEICTQLASRQQQVKIKGVV